jgi:hypothetical protein
MKSKFLFSIVILFFAQFSWAYQYRVCLDRDLKWDRNNVGVGASNVSFADSNWRNSLATAVDRWNQAPSNFSYSFGTDSNGVRRGNGENEVWFSDDPGALQGAPAIAYTWWECIDYWIFGKTVKITESDVIFDVNESYTPFMNNKNTLWEYGGAYRPFQNTAAHELGHGLGLMHVNYNYNVMGTDWTHIHVNGANARSYVGEDAGRGAARLYGNRNIQDLGLSQWKYGSASGEYSAHIRNVLKNSAGATLGSSTIGGEPVYNVTAGQGIKVEFTLENNGNNTQTVSIGYYLSTNDVITTIDSLVTEKNVTTSPDSTFVYSTSVTIPAGTPKGYRWIGAVIDNKNAVGEVTESNNATYFRINVN